MTSLGSWLAPPRFLLFLAALAAATALAWPLGWPRAWMYGFDAAAALFLLSCIPLFRLRDPDRVAAKAAANDANRALLLVVAVSVTAAVLAAVAAETTAAKASAALVIATLALAWAFANTIYALHYAHLYYNDGAGGLKFSGDRPPTYADFAYFAFTLGMTFQTSDTAVESPAMRREVTLHSLLAFAFNIGVIAFTVNTLGK